MMIRQRHRQSPMPTLNTASLPDLIFTVLFFFMIVTHMRKVTLKVKYRVPAGTELTRLTKKSAVSYIYVGLPPQSQYGSKSGKTRIQINDKYVNPDDIADYIAADRQRMSPEDQAAMTVSIKADRLTQMSVIDDIRQSLRIANVKRINFSAVKRR